MLDSATAAASAPTGCADSAPAGTEETITVTYHHIRTREVVELTGSFICWQRLRSGPKRDEPGATLRLEDGEIRIVPVSLLTGASRQLLGEPDISMKPDRRRRRP